jgi:hypothetical protein
MNVNEESGEDTPEKRWAVGELSEAPPELRAHMQRARREMVARGFSGPDPIKLDFQDFTFRAIGNRLYWRDSHSTYVDFLLDLIKFAFGPKWHKQQVETEESQRHLVMRWGMSWYLHCMKAEAEQNTGERTIFRAEPTGDAQALLTLADDLYRLQLARSLTSELMRRLRSSESFQGARYEIQVASIFLRSGFEIEWVSEKEKKHCEFYAVHRHSRQRVAVEAKSRKRPGVLGQTGEVRLDHPWGLEKLYDDARQQNPRTCPFCIFIDVNWPVQPRLPKWQKPWMGEVYRLAQKYNPTPDNPEMVTLSAFTNYSWHYQGAGLALPHETLISWPLHPTHPITDAATRDALAKSIFTYGVQIEESPTPMVDENVLDQLAAL